MDFSLLLSSYATVWSNPEVLLMTFIGALGGVLLGAIPGMTATMGVALLIPFSFGMDSSRPSACCWASTAAVCTAVPFPLSSSTPPARPPQPHPAGRLPHVQEGSGRQRHCPLPCSPPSAAASSAHWS